MRMMLTFEVIYDYMMKASETGTAQLQGIKRNYQHKMMSGSKVSV